MKYVTFGEMSDQGAVTIEQTNFSDDHLRRYRASPADE